MQFRIQGAEEGGQASARSNFFYFHTVFGRKILPNNLPLASGISWIRHWDIPELGQEPSLCIGTGLQKFSKTSLEVKSLSHISRPSTLVLTSRPPWWHRKTRSPLTAMASPDCCLWLGLTQCHMWDVFRPSQPMPGGFPLGVFVHPQKGSKFFWLEPSHKANWPGLARTCSVWRKINGFTFTWPPKDHSSKFVAWSATVVVQWIHVSVNNH